MRACCKQNVFIAFSLQLIKAWRFLAAYELRAHALGKGYVLCYGVACYPEFWYNVFNYAARLVFLFKHGNGITFAGNEVRRGYARGACAYYGGFLGLLRGGGGKARHYGVVAFLCGYQLKIADIHAFIIKIARAFIHAPVGAYCAGYERQRVLFKYQLQRLGVHLLFDQLYILAHVLVYRAAAHAGRCEAIRNGQGKAVLPVRQGLYGLFVMRVGFRIRAKLSNLCRVYARVGAL